MRTGQKAMTDLPSMLVGLAKAEIEVVEPLPIEFSQATPDDLPPVRGDAVAERPPRPLPDHPACAGRPRVDRCDRPRVRHLRVLAARRRGRHERLSRVQRGPRRRRRPLGRGDRRHDRAAPSSVGVVAACGATRTGSGRSCWPGSSPTSSRTSTRWASPPSSDRCRRPAGAGSSAPTAASHRRTSGRSTAPSAACACCAADREAAQLPLYDYDCAACGRRFEVIHGVHADPPEACPLCGEGPVRKAITAPTVHYKGSGWAKKERRAAVKAGVVVAATTRPRRGRRRRRRAPRRPSRHHRRRIRVRGGGVGLVVDERVAAGRTGEWRRR